MRTNETVIVRVFTHAAVSHASELVSQIDTAAASAGFDTIVIDADADPGVVIAAGVVALPAVIVEANGIEVARKECLGSRRSLQRWLDRRLTAVEIAPALTLAFA